MNTPKGGSEKGNGDTTHDIKSKGERSVRETSASPGRDVHTSYPTTINYNGWMDADNYQLRYQLMFEAERELLKIEKTENKLTFYTIFDEVVAGVGEEYAVKLSLHMETPPALSVSTKDGNFVGMFYLRDPEFQSSPTSMIKETEK